MIVVRLTAQENQFVPATEAAVIQIRGGVIVSPSGRVKCVRFLVSMEQTMATPRAAFVTLVTLEPGAISSALCTESARTTLAYVTSFKATKALCVKFRAVPDGRRIAVTMAPATKPPKSVPAIQHGLVLRVTSQTVPVPLTVMGVARVLHP